MSFDIPPDLAAGLRAWIADIVRTELRVQLAGIVPSPKVPPSPYMTAKEAGEYARVSAATIRKWIRTGRLQAHGTGRDSRVRIDDLVDTLRPQPRRSANRATARELSPEELAHSVVERWEGEREMLRRAQPLHGACTRTNGIAEIASDVAARTGAKRRTGRWPAATVLAATVLPHGAENDETEQDELGNPGRAGR